MCESLQTLNDWLESPYSSEKTAVLAVYGCLPGGQEVAGSNPVAPIET